MKTSLFTAALLLASCGSPQPKSEEPLEHEPTASEPEAAIPSAPEKPPAPAIDTAAIDGSPLAEPPLVLRFEEGWNQHHQFGASGMHLDSEVVVYLHQGGGARINDAGEHRTSELSEQWGYREEKKVWDNAWHGTWTTEPDSLILELSPTKRVCTIHVTDYGDQKSTKDCPETPPRVRVVCDARQIDVAPTPLGREEDARPHDVWLCFPDEGAEALGGSPPAWVFSEQACIRISTGFRGKSRSYSSCGDDATQKGAKLEADQ